MDISLPDDFDKVLLIVKKLWEEAHEADGIFRYKLDVKEDKILDGHLSFYCQLNPKRANLRRLPQQIESLNKPFDDSTFNFKKILPKEHLLEVNFNKNSFSFIINQSPLTKYHILICPELNSGLSQILTRESILFALSFLKFINDINFRIGYNSPGALASVNHLHLHLMYIGQKLYVDSVKLKQINGNFHTLENSSFNQAFCYEMWRNECDENSANIIFDLISMLCIEGIPHNLFFIKMSDHSIRVYIFVREKPAKVKDYSKLNIAFCEFSGYVPVGDESLYENLSEEILLQKIKSEVGNSFDCVKRYIKLLPLSKS